MESIIEIKNLCKSFGTVRAVDDLSFHVKTGELFAFLGVNGAGKSTTINIMCGSLQKDSGSVIIDGSDIDSARKSAALGIVFQNSVLDGALTVKENLKSRAALYGISGKDFSARFAELRSMLDFADFENRTVSKLSGGQRRRIDIARALFHRPGILILDEPTTGLDPQTRRLLWQVIDEIRRKENMTVFLTTHYMEEAADADYVVILDGGKIAAEGSPLELKNTYTGDFITLYGASEAEAAALGSEYEKIHGGYRISVGNTHKVTELITEHPEIFRDYEIVKGKMDDVFLAVTGKKLSGGDER
jgi:multidrug/hemolysin transport system ATP-binding protein